MALPLLIVTKITLHACGGPVETHTAWGWDYVYTHSRCGVHVPLSTPIRNTKLPTPRYDTAADPT